MMASTNLAFLIVILGACGTYAIECPNGWTTYHNSCYYHGHHSMSYKDAEVFCHNRTTGAHLVHVTNAIEQRFVASYLSNFQASTHWIGLNDRRHEETYVWTDHKASQFFHWAPNEPSHHRTGDCVLISSQVQYGWVNTNCSLHNYPLCELRGGHTGTGHVATTVGVVVTDPVVPIVTNPVVPIVTTTVYVEPEPPVDPKLTGATVDLG